MAPPGYSVDDGAGLLFAGDELVEAVSARAGAGAWWVDADGSGAVTEAPLEMRLLPRDDQPPPLEIAEFRRARTGSAGFNRPARRAAGLGD
jgi:hypothetical protein